jgi:hypothetical protein
MAGGGAKYASLGETEATPTATAGKILSMVRLLCVWADIFMLVLQEKQSKAQRRLKVWRVSGETRSRERHLVVQLGESIAMQQGSCLKPFHIFRPLGWPPPTVGSP